MKKLTHTHFVVKDSPESPHVDSRGVPFGHAEHTEAVGNAKFPEGSNVVTFEHSHSNLRIGADPITKLEVWEYEEPETEDAKPRRKEAVAVS